MCFDVVFPPSPNSYVMYNCVCSSTVSATYGQVLRQYRKTRFSDNVAFFSDFFNVRMSVGEGCKVQGRHSLELWDRCSGDGRLSSHEAANQKLSS